MAKVGKQVNGGRKSKCRSGGTRQVGKQADGAISTGAGRWSLQPSPGEDTSGLLRRGCNLPA